MDEGEQLLLAIEVLDRYGGCDVTHQRGGIDLILDLTSVVAQFGRISQRVVEFAESLAEATCKTQHEEGTHERIPVHAYHLLEELPTLLKALYRTFDVFLAPWRLVDGSNGLLVVVHLTVLDDAHHILELTLHVILQAVYRLAVRADDMGVVFLVLSPFYIEAVQPVRVSVAHTSLHAYRLPGREQQLQHTALTLHAQHHHSRFVERQCHFFRINGRHAEDVWSYRLVVRSPGERQRVICTHILEIEIQHCLTLGISQGGQ